MMWFTYKALTSAFTQEDVSAYEAEFHRAVADMVGRQMNLAALEYSLFERVTPLVSEAIALGGSTFDALRTIDTTQSSQTDLMACNTKALDLATIYFAHRVCSWW